MPKSATSIATGHPGAPPTTRRNAPIGVWFLAAVLAVMTLPLAGGQEPSTTLAPVPDAVAEPVESAKTKRVAHDPLRPVAVRRAALAAAAGGVEEPVPPVPLPVIDEQILRPEIVPEQAGRLWIFRVLNQPAESDLDWSVIPEVEGFTEDTSGTLAYAAFDAEPALYHVVVSMASGGKASTLVCPIQIGPPAPLPPGPGPTPDPNPSPAPIPEAGFRVLIVEETAERGKLPKSQVTVLSSTKVREYLNAKCAKGPDGKTPEWRQFDDDVDLKNESSIWQAAINRDRKSLPWIVISTGKDGFEGPLPATEAETLTLLKRYGDTP